MVFRAWALSCVSPYALTGPVASRRLGRFHANEQLAIKHRVAAASVTVTVSTPATAGVGTGWRMHPGPS